MKTGSKSYRAALYMRLSRDDDGVNESSSISNQRKMLRSYAAENSIDVYDEYVDDGWSGTNFDRPSWKRLLRDIEDKKVNMVITKDLSRLGRDYISAGQYTEIYFPSKGVRYVAVDDGYDSESPCTDIAPIKNVINEMYARDTSRKIRSALRTKMREGAFIGNFAPYGYIKDPQNKNRLLPDHTAAPIVRDIFKMAEEGCSPAQIAQNLNGRGIMTPAMYRCHLRPYLSTRDHSGRKEWTSSMICKMLRNIVYLGHIAQGKTTKVSFKSDITRQNPRDEWIVAENMHEPLISQETFSNVKRRSVSRRRPPKTYFKNIFSGIAKCSDCGRNMSTTGSRRKGSVCNLVCGGYKLRGSGECQNHFIDYEALYDAVLRDIKTHLCLSEEERQELLDTLDDMTARMIKPEEESAVKSLKEREKELDRIIGRLYEDIVLRGLDEERYYKMLASFEAERKDVSARIASLNEPEGEAERSGEDHHKLISLLDDITGATELTHELLAKLIDRIEICQGSYAEGRRGGHKKQTIRVYYRFASQTEKNVNTGTA